MIPYARQSLDHNDIDAVIEVLKSDYLTQGNVVPEFEKALCLYTGARFGVAVNSGTSALHIACLALGLSELDWLWTTPVTFVASANCGIYCGAKIDFVDINKNTWNIDADKLELKLQQAEKSGILPKIVVVVHLAGMPADLQRLHQLSVRYGFYIIEDACHALGGTYHDAPVGRCDYSDITVFSFHPVKSITTGEGGMAVTNDPVLAEKMRLHANHGITRNAKLMENEPDGDWHYQQIDIGFNYRMSDIHAALGLSQLSRLDDFIRKRNELAESYFSQLAGLPLQLPVKPADRTSAWHLFVVRLAGEAHLDRKWLFEAMRENGIGVNVHYFPVHLQPYYRRMGFKHGDYPDSEAYYQQCLTLPCYPDLSFEQQQHVVLTLKDLLS